MFKEYIVREIEWDVEEDVGLPTTTTILAESEDDVVDLLSDKWEYCIKSVGSIELTLDEKNKRAWNTLTCMEKIKLYEEEAKNKGLKFYEFVEDSYQYDNGLLLILYNDTEHIDERNHICFNLDDYRDFCFFQGGQI